MPRRKSATDKKAEVQPVESVESQSEVEETQPSETAENETEVSKVETVENPTVEAKKKRFGYKWIFIGLALISIILFIVYFGNIKDFFLADESRIYVIGGVIIALAVGLLVWYVPKKQVKKLASESSEEKLTNFEREEKRLKLEDDTRKTLAQIIGGVFLIAGLFVTYNTYRLGTDTYRLGLEQQKISVQKQDLDRRGQITDRFNKAVTNLGNQDLSVRLGGLYALEQILKDSPEDHQTIIEVLSAYIREKAKIKKDTQELNQNENKQSKTSAPTPTQNDSIPMDVQTAITILGRRPTREGQKESRINLADVNLRTANINDADLRGADLRGADLRGADFRNASLSNANLSNANLSGASLIDATFIGADFSDANLISTNLGNSNLSDAYFVGARLIGARLTGSDFTSADFTGADFTGADLSGAFLSRAHLSVANLVGANLVGANLVGANLVGANLRNADLNGAELYNVDLLSSQLKFAIFDSIFLHYKELDRESALKYFREKEAENNK